jgi:hypothetical protein
MGNVTSKKPPAIKVYSLKVEAEKFARFTTAAQSKNRSAAQQLRHLIDQEVREFEANGEAA